MTETPIFDTVLKDQGVDEMPLPPLETHEKFMHKRAHDVWLDRAEMILRGEMDPYDGETDDPRDNFDWATGSEPKWFINENGDAYDYPADHQELHFPNDDHTPYDTQEEAEAASDEGRTRWAKPIPIKKAAPKPRPPRKKVAKKTEGNSVVAMEDIMPPEAPDETSS